MRPFLISILAPLAMTAIAGLHAISVGSYGLTPWKGGGFGMFSTVDSRGARFIRCYLEAEGVNGYSIPVELPRVRALATQVDRVRALPSEAGLQHLAAALSTMRWSYYVADKEVDSPAAAMDAGRDSDAAYRFDNPSASHDEAALVGVLRGATSGIPVGQRFRVLASADPRTDSLTRKSSVRFTRLRLEAWRFRMNESGDGLVSELLRTATFENKLAPMVGGHPIGGGTHG